ncbi:hypothetical protein CANTEDRAFT_91948 [Yamadazyma tenuis ATCC 10573]|uniref:Uncharacterized protein n=1 Tax=Candida tenuis (strain ATCC 10573 / BCRC 21748 / CBS 615 / JCM 9827 / NBRC 10315 / NRRL Y-1498 / VKM Y-70) TaxID=590646 RepID=G3AZP3_CANTC|nr:uncharacterized protein CANTEDRAFT_91948 [Yamadazyma tenuis ATCC 10573]EGV65637.1 hypothetical protein CANTEDRAFT_91948 [Yamadazyma tenuis ATCC 10573]
MARLIGPWLPRVCHHLTPVRHYSIAIPRRRATFTEVLRTPTTKSLFLTIVFGSCVTEVIARRKQLDTLRDSHHARMIILNDILARLQHGEHIDLQKELRLLSQVSDGMDFDVDEKLNQLFQMVEEPTKPTANKSEFL